MSLGFLLIVLAVLAVIGSLLWLLPSEADRRRMRLRQQAFSQGVKVREAREEMKRWGLADAEPEVLMQYYRLDPDAGAEQWLIANPLLDWAAHPELEKELSPSTAVDVPWSEMPADVILWEKQGPRYGFYWYERGSPEQLVRALECLKALEAWAPR